MIHPNDVMIGQERLKMIEANTPEPEENAGRALYFIGLALTIAAWSFFWWGPELNVRRSRDLDNVFVWHFMSVCYLFALFINRKNKTVVREAGFIWLSLCTVVCFMVNRDIQIFSPFTTWCNIALTILGILTAIYPWLDRFGRLKSGFYFLLSASGVLCLYFALRLIPVLPAGILGMIIFGIGLYAFIPLFFVVAISRKLHRAWDEFKVAIIAGLVTPLVVLAVFIVSWHSFDQKAIGLMTKKSNLPDWVELSKELPKNWLSQQWLLNDIKYENGSWDRFFLNINGGGQANATRLHEPLIFLSTINQSKRYDLTTNDKLKTLATLFGNDHVREMRLWGGENLNTSGMKTTVKLLPQQGVAETTKEWIITNNEENSWSQQEAIYTFHLPEGAAVTDLSLWVNDVEEKGHLTAKSRAVRAYQEIVGVQKRDPSLVQWKEGNKISLRVFPCPAENPRRVKFIYVSALTPNEDGHLTYQNALFDGPPSDLGAHKVFIEGAEKVSASGLLLNKEGSANEVMSKDWLLTLNEKANPSPTGELGRGFAPLAIYLDINEQWEASWVKQIMVSAGSTPVRVWKDEKWVTLNAQNSSNSIKALLRQHFSFFPFYAMPDTNGLVITADSDASPLLTDLRSTSFGESTTAYFANGNSVKVFAINGLHSPWLQTLAQFQVLQVQSGNIETLKSNLEKRIFKKDNTDLLVDTSANGPAAKLVAYQRLLKQISSDYFKAADAETEEIWIEAARKAGVVSPISSLIVLETQEDYERFNIDGKGDKKNNAVTATTDITSMPQIANQNSGSVPEPREWALIIFSVLVMTFLWVKRSIF